MFKKSLSILLVLIFALSLTGCFSKSKTENTVKPAQQAAETEDKDTVTIAYVAMAGGSAQAFINQKFSIFADELKAMGKKVNYVTVHGLQEVYPLMDKKTGAPDFIYLPNSAFTTYTTNTSKFGGSNKYAVIAGSVNQNTINLIARPEIKSLKDLAGKKVGIANLRYTDEYQLDKVLSKEGLKLSTNGGTVQVVWDDVVGKLFENYGAGKYDAITNFDDANNLQAAMSKVPGSRIITLNPNGLFGEKQPRVWLAAKKDLIQNNPELVKAFLKAHILSTDKAIANAQDLPVLNREERVKWMQRIQAKAEDIERTNKLEKFQQTWKAAGITYDPNMTYITELFSYMEKRGVVKGQTIDTFVQIEPLNTVLKEMNRPPLKQ